MKTVQEVASSSRNQISTEFAAKRVPRSEVAARSTSSRLSESLEASAMEARMSLRLASVRSRSLNASSCSCERRRWRRRSRSSRIARSGPSSRSRTKLERLERNAPHELIRDLGIRRHDDETERRLGGEVEDRGPHLYEAASEGLGSRHPDERPVREEFRSGDLALVVALDEEASGRQSPGHPGHCLRLAHELDPPQDPVAVGARGDSADRLHGAHSRRRRRLRPPRPA